MLTQAEKGGNIVKLSRGSGRAKEHRVLGAPDGWRQNEKVLDKRSETWYHIKVRCESGGRLDESSGFELLELKSSEKSLKKALDSNKTVWYNERVPAAEVGRAPCKLNNVKKHEAPEEDKKFS